MGLDNTPTVLQRIQHILKGHNVIGVILHQHSNLDFFFHIVLLSQGRTFPAARYRLYHCSRVSSIQVAVAICSIRRVLLLPVSTCIRAGWQRIQAMATAAGSMS